MQVLPHLADKDLITLDMKTLGSRKLFHMALEKLRLVCSTVAEEEQKEHEYYVKEAADIAQRKAETGSDFDASDNDEKESLVAATDLPNASSGS